MQYYALVLVLDGAAAVRGSRSVLRGCFRCWWLLVGVLHGVGDVGGGYCDCGWVLGWRWCCHGAEVTGVTVGPWCFSLADGTQHQCEPFTPILIMLHLAFRLFGLKGTVTGKK